jgi:hypothetical protein
MSIYVEEIQQSFGVKNAPDISRNKIRALTAHFIFQQHTGQDYVTTVYFTLTTKQEPRDWKEPFHACCFFDNYKHKNGTKRLQR